MFELITGYHPLLKQGDDRAVLESKLIEYREFEFPAESVMSKQAKHLIQTLCQRAISSRFSATQALQHPWVTRNLDEELPLTQVQMQQQEIDNLAIEDKLRKAINVVYVCGLAKRKALMTRTMFL